MTFTIKLFGFVLTLSFGKRFRVPLERLKEGLDPLTPQNARE